MPRVLLIDDSPSVRRLLQAVLSRSGFEVHAAASGEEGLELAPRVAPELVLLDLGLPGIDGIEVLRRMRADPELAPIPIVFLTGSAHDEAGAALASSGAAAVLPKENVTELPRRLRAVLQARRS